MILWRRRSCEEITRSCSSTREDSGRTWWRWKCFHSLVVKLRTAASWWRRNWCCCCAICCSRKWWWWTSWRNWTLPIVYKCVEEIFNLVIKQRRNFLLKFCCWKRWRCHFWIFVVEKECTFLRDSFVRWFYKDETIFKYMYFSVPVLF